MELVKTKVLKNDKEYIDLYLKWTYEGKEYLVRVRPVFACDYDKLIATSNELNK